MAQSSSIRALRGATTVETDTPDHVSERVQEMVRALMERNELEEDDVISAIFTATDDVTSIFPATAVRAIGFGAVPLLCAREIPVPGSKPLCIRALLHIATHKTPRDLHHVYLHGAQGLRDDLPG